MTPTFTVDASQWRKAARDLAKTSSRSAADFINGQALFVCIQAIKLTIKTQAEKIRQQLGVVGHNLRSVKARKGPNAGRVVLRKGKALIKEDSFAERILAARFRKTQQWGKGISGSTMEERARQFINQRAKSAAFIASGWIWPMRQLWGVVKKKPAARPTDAKAFGQPKGSASPASEGQRARLSAIIENTALSANAGQFPAPGGDPLPIASNGLQAALDFAARDMMGKLAERLGQDLAPYNARPGKRS